MVDYRYAHLCRPYNYITQMPSRRYSISYQPSLVQLWSTNSVDGLYSLHLTPACSSHSLAGHLRPRFSTPYTPHMPRRVSAPMPVDADCVSDESSPQLRSLSSSSSTSSTIWPTPLCSFLTRLRSCHSGMSDQVTTLPWQMLNRPSSIRAKGFAFMVRSTNRPHPP